MTTPDELRQAAARARQQAADHRRLAGRLDASHVHELARLCDDRTWVGPLADALQDEVRRAGAALRELATELRRQATNLERQAADHDRAATRAALLLASA